MTWDGSFFRDTTGNFLNRQMMQRSGEPCQLPLKTPNPTQQSFILICLGFPLQLISPVLSARHHGNASAIGWDGAISTRYSGFVAGWHPNCRLKCQRARGMERVSANVIFTHSFYERLSLARSLSLSLSLSERTGSSPSRRTGAVEPGQEALSLSRERAHTDLQHLNRNHNRKWICSTPRTFSLSVPK